MRYFVESYGCTMNYGEGDDISEKMSSAGHSPADSADDADIVVLNTCTVIDTTEKKMIHRISELKRAGKEIIVTGCMAKVQRSRVSIRLPDSIILPPGSYDSLPAMVTDRYGAGDGRDASNGNGTNNDAKAATIIPIAQGCLGDCTYCITRFARGSLESYPADRILERFGEAVAGGCREVLITAQDTACYGFDAGGSLPELMNRLLTVKGEYRIRIGMMNPESLERILDPLMDVMSDERVYRFIHVPVQSGSDRILKKMGRRYTSSQFSEMVERIRARYEDISISTDIISGFPGESDSDHGMSVDLIRRISPDTVNVTRFSPRPGTEAALMDDQIHGRTSKERSRNITATKSDEAMNRNKNMIGMTVRALVTECGKDGTMIARTGNYRPVIISGDHEIGEFLDIVITNCEPTHLFGRVLL
jgi:MiaB-like tRNA modifying enzyme